ncbi:hypothetical protein HR13_02295 [Porphyromonas gulae]|uniref:Uncharacterized protein n=1 Tax=Porphyromonas gulae TaxID=111105 RepID=A0A0A2EU64_9PORP|nr:hypothetical protein HR13_02295 [Porphyromonas gulae]KGN83733.1 hypothetical protein HR15_11645 [Porphyromonas gulae]
MGRLARKMKNGFFEPKTVDLRHVFSRKLAREKNRFGARIFYFPNQNKNFYAPRFFGARIEKISLVNAQRGTEARGTSDSCRSVGIFVFCRA